jgi:hypothetical protein
MPFAIPRNLVNRSLAIALAALTVCAGCNSKSSVGKVHGKVTLDGRPLAFGQIATIPSAGRGAHGVVKDGEFQLGTYGENDGAVIGSHKVAVIAREAAKDKGPEAAAGKSLIPDRYTNPYTSQLSIDVQSGDNTPTLELKSDGR